MRSSRRSRAGPSGVSSLKACLPTTDAYDHGVPGSRPERHHLRCNIVVSLQHPSGRPVIEGEALEVGERDMWVFTASRHMHQTAPLQGGDARVVYGFGWSVPSDHALRQPPERAVWAED